MHKGIGHFWNLNLLDSTDKCNVIDDTWTSEHRIQVKYFQSKEIVSVLLMFFSFPVWVQNTSEAWACAAEIKWLNCSLVLKMANAFFPSAWKMCKIIEVPYGKKQLSHSVCVCKPLSVYVMYLFHTLVLNFLYPFFWSTFCKVYFSEKQVLIVCLVHSTGCSGEK